MGPDRERLVRDARGRGRAARAREEQLDRRRRALRWARAAVQWTAPRVGLNAAHVELVVDGEAARRTEQAGATALTDGRRVFLHPERWQPGRPEAERTLAHELVHVAQMRLGAAFGAPEHPARAEAGLVALKQLLERQGDEPLFRDGAAVNVVFISDTHDPGFSEGRGFEALDRMRPDYDELVELVDRANVVSSFRVHAIAPMEGCVGVEDFSAVGTTYYDVALASGGRIIDVCKANDYSAIFSDLVAVGSVPSAGVVDLGTASEVTRVEVNGEPVDYTVHRDGRVVRIDRKLADGVNDVRVYTR